MRETYDPPLALPVSEIKPGHILDLEGDIYTAGAYDSIFDFEFQTVYAVERESADCIALGGENWDIGFPPYHLLTVVGFISLED